MKRSKIFLGITTTLLAVAGMAAAKHYGPSVLRFYITSSQHYCKAMISVCTRVNGGTNQCFYIVSTVPLIEYPLFTKGPDGIFPGSGQNCQTPAKYNLEH